MAARSRSSLLSRCACVSWARRWVRSLRSARLAAVARVDDSVTVQYGAQADEDAIRSQLQAVAVYGTFSTSPTGQYSGAAVAALSLRTTQALTPQPGQH